MRAEELLAVGKWGAGKVEDLSTGDVGFLEHRIDEISEALPPIAAFTIPGGHVIVSQTHLCRTVCRRAERRACEAAVENDIPMSVLRFLNRLSDYFYVLGRRLAMRLNTEEVLWVP